MNGDFNSPGLNVGPTISVSPYMQAPSSSPQFFDEHAAFQDYINKIRLQSIVEAADKAKRSAEAGTRRNLLGMATIGGLGGGLAGYAKGKTLGGSVTPALLGAAAGGIAGLAAPSELGNAALGAGIGAVPGAYLGHQVGKKYPKYAIPALVAGLLGGAGAGGLLGQ